MPAQRPGALQLGTIGSFLHGRLRGESALSYTEPDGGSVDQSRGTQHQAVRLGLTGIEGRMHYGLTYRSAGDAALTENGLESREAWVGWRSSFLAVRSSILQRSNHPAQDPSRSRITALQKRLALDLTLPAWPALTIAYTQGLSSHSFESVRSNPTRTHTDSFETSLNYALSRLKVHAESTYTTDDFLHSGPASVRLQHLVSGSYSPLAALTFSSTLMFTDDRDGWSSRHTEAPSAELAMAYHARPDFDVSVLSSYSRTHDGLGNLDLRHFNAKSLLSWRAARTGWAAATLSLETAYSTTTDAAYAARPPDNLSTVFHLTLMGRSWGDFLRQESRLSSP